MSCLPPMTGNGKHTIPPINMGILGMVGANGIVLTTNHKLYKGLKVPYSKAREGKKTAFIGSLSHVVFLEILILMIPYPPTC